MRAFYIPLTTAVLMACSAGTTDMPPQAQDVTALSSSLPALESPFVWDLDTDKSALTFEADHNGVFTGHFSRFAAAIKLDPQHPSEGVIHAIVDLSSVDAGDSDRNANLPLAEWFDMSAFPTAAFNSSTITATASGFDAAGELTMKGISQPATLAFTLQTNGNTARAQGNLALDRRDFKLGTGADFTNEDWVKFPVTVKVDITANK